MAAGRTVRISPAEAEISQLASLKDLPPEKAEQKLLAVKQGGNLASEASVFPPQRQCQDMVFAIAFLSTAMVLLGYGFMHGRELLRNHGSEHRKFVDLEEDHSVMSGGIKFVGIRTLLVAVIAGIAGSLATSFGLVVVAFRQPAFVVWASLIFGPVLLIAGGVSSVVIGLSKGHMIVALFGAFGVFVGFCCLFAVFCCYLRLIPFMIKLTEVVAQITMENPCILITGPICAAIGIAWVALVAVALGCIFLVNRDVDEKPSVSYTFVAIFAFLLNWGIGVSANIAHVTYCGVFGHWYYGKGSEDSESDEEERRGRFVPSLVAACTTSLGSICFGSLLVSVVRALEAVARQFTAENDDNCILCILGCCFMCCLNCIGDILEYFNDWAYVQCAVRGVNFYSAASIEYSLMTCANMKYIISDLLLDSLNICGGLLAAGAGAACGAFAGFAIAGTTIAAGWGGSLGFFVGLASGFACLGVFGSGMKTILSCWAEDPGPLLDSHPEVHEEFNRRLIKGFEDGSSRVLSRKSP